MTDRTPAAAPLAAGRMVRRAPLAELPFWPLYLSREEAARYVGVSLEVFDAEVRAGLWPPGRPRGGRGGRLTWNRALLEATAHVADGLVASPMPAAPMAVTATPADAADDRWAKRIAEVAARRRERKHAG